MSICPGVQFNFIDFIGFFPPILACFCLDSCALLASLYSYPIQAVKSRAPICYQLLDTFALSVSNPTHREGGKPISAASETELKSNLSYYLIAYIMS